MSRALRYRDVERALVTRLEDLPDFDRMSREEEAEWWETHDIAEDLMESGPEVDTEVFEALGIDRSERK